MSFKQKKKKLKIELKKELSICKFGVLSQCNFTMHACVRHHATHRVCFEVGNILKGKSR
jgi:hypothetical protein